MENEYKQVDQLSENVKKIIGEGGKAAAEYYYRYKREIEIRFIHEITALEGNSVTLEEARSILKGKEAEEEATRERKREIQEIRNYFKALQFVKKYIRRGVILDERLVRRLHEIVTERIYHGGIYRNISVWIPDTGAEFPSHSDLRTLMGEFSGRLKERIMVCRLPEAFHPIELAAWAFAEIIRIHPFLEGNERVGALMMNYLLMEHAFLPVSIPRDRQREYHEIMNRYRWEREIVPFACFIEELEQEELLALEQGAKKVV